MKKAIEEKPDLILMDILMAEMDGREATRMIRSNPMTMEIPIIAVSVLFRHSDRKSCFEAGCNDYISHLASRCSKRRFELLFQFQSQTPNNERSKETILWRLFRKSDLSSCLEAGCSDYLVKLFTLREFKGKIQDYFPAH